MGATCQVLWAEAGPRGTTSQTTLGGGDDARRSRGEISTYAVSTNPRGVRLRHKLTAGATVKHFYLCKGVGYVEGVRKLTLAVI